MIYLKLYVTALAIFFSIDLLWLGVIAKNLYRDQIGFLMVDQIRWVPAILFYVLYLVGLVLFAIWPAHKESSASTALMYGALFGFIAYATYDLTNLATLKGWPIKIVIYDMIWGAFISGATATLTYWISAHWKPFYR